MLIKETQVTFTLLVAPETKAYAEPATTVQELTKTSLPSGSIIYEFFI